MDKDRPYLKIGKSKGCKKVLFEQLVLKLINKTINNMSNRFSFSSNSYKSFPLLCFKTD
jgi:hypothetical protein